MKAIALTFKTGQGRVVELPKPVLTSPKDVLVKVKFSAVDTAVKEVVDKTTTGYFVHSRSNPLVLGWHYVGTVITIGVQAETYLQVGDEVWGFLDYIPKQNQGSFSEYVTVDASKCSRIPDGVDPKVAAAASTEVLTALQAMRDYGGLSADKKSSVLILGAGGGVGSVAVGIAKRLGAHVTAVCSTKDVQRVKELGADVVVDRSKSDVLNRKDHTKYDIIFDTPAKYSALQCFKLLNPKGSYVTTLPTLSLVAGMFVSMFNGKRASFVECDSKVNDLQLVGEWLADGLVVNVDSTFPIRDIDKALSRQQDKSKVGRVVIQVLGGW